VKTYGLALLLAVRLTLAQAAENSAPVHNVDGSFVKEWLVLGPIPSKDLETDFLADAGGEANVRPKEGDTIITKDGRTLSWVRVRSDTDWVNLEGTFGLQEWAVAYAYCELQSNEAMETDLRVFSPIPPAIWINGVRQAYFPAYRISRRIDIPPALPIRLNRGRNGFLLKLKHERHEWQFLTQPLPQDRATAELIVTDPAGNIAGNAVAAFYDRSELVARIRTDQAGKASACLYPLAKTYDMRVTSGEWSAWISDVSLKPGERRQINVRLADAVSITGRVLAMDGSPQTAIVVQALRKSATETSKGSFEGSNIKPLLPAPDFLETALTDGSGRYRFVNLRPGNYELRCHASEGFEAPKSASSAVSASGTFPVKSGATLNDVDFIIPEVKKGVWKHFPTAAGLTATQTQSLLQTPDGALWIGTPDGTLHMYDGVEYKLFRRPDIPGASVYDLKLAADGSVWIATSGGTVRFVDGKIQPLAFNDLLPRKAAISLETGRDGVVWVGTSSGLWKHEGQRMESFTTTNGLPSNTINSLQKARDGALWAGTWNGLVRHDGQKFERLDLFQGFSSHRLGKLHQSKDGALWICSDTDTASGVYRYDGKSFYQLSTEDGLVSDEVRDIAETSDGTLWFATAGALSRYDGRTIVNYHEPDGLSQGDLLGLWVDADDVIWCATRGGVFRFDPASIVSVTRRDGLVNKDGGTPAVFAIEPASDGWFFIGAEWGGPFRTNGKLVERVPLFSPEAKDTYVRKIHRAADGVVWFGVNNGIYRLEEKGLVRVLPHEWVLALSSDREGNLWYGHGWNGGGLSRYNTKTGEQALFTTANGLPNNNVWSVTESPEGGIWIGSEGALVRFRHGAMENPEETLGVQIPAVRNFHRDAEGSLWASSVVGLHQLTGAKRRSITITNGLPDQNAWASVQGRDGIVWMATDSSGLVGYDGKAATVIDKRDGLIGNRPFSLAVDSNGSLLVGFLEGGLVRYRRSKTPPSVRLTEVRLDDQSFAPGSDFPGMKTGNRITIQYQETDLKTHPEKRQFRQQVVDSSGNVVLASVTKERRFDWTPQKGGAYTFEVQAIDRDLNYSKPAGLAFRATVPWYANAWITAPGAGAFGGLLIWAFVAGALYVSKRRESERLQQRFREALEEKNRQLQGAKEIAESANQAKSTFLANMSHEIRTPLNAVLGYAQILRRDSKLADDQRQAVGAIERSGNHLLALINEILDLSKIESGHSELLETDFDLREMILGLSEMFELRCREKGLDWRVEWVSEVQSPRSKVQSPEGEASQLSNQTPLNCFRVHGDETKLRQVLINLLSNAVKFTDAGRVSLRVAAPNGSFSSPGSGQKPPAPSNIFTFEVEDTGPGIAGAAHEEIFQTFTQGVEGKRKGGTGLGLTIARHQIELMGGDLRLQSELGRGSRFFFSLHLPPLSEEVPSQAERAAKPTERMKLLVPIRALVLDDLAENREILGRLLNELGATVTLMEGGEQALDELRSHPYDIAFLDIQMPGMNGFEVAGRVLVDSAFRGVKLVAASASVLKHEQEYCLQKGFDAFVGKPVRLDEICECLKNLLSATFETQSTSPEARLQLLSAGAGSSEGIAPEEDFDPGLAERQPLRILVADDSEMNQELVASVLQKFGYGCHLAGNGREVIYAVERERFDLVFLDVQMPEMDGYETAREIRTRWSGSDRPRLVAMTANASRADREKCLEAGMDEFISKPVHIPEIRRALERCPPRHTPQASGNPGNSAATAGLAPRPESASAEGPIDWRRLKKMFGADPGTVRRFVNQYMQETSVLIEQLRAALNSGHASEVGVLAHRGKGTSANFGMEAMTEPLQRLEDAARSADLSDGPQLLAAIEASFDLTKKAAGG
jgi:signal transduction histidine kinase/DNA-binding response OmpR family regulator/ligand-binding sensor domain-containing protein/HPt (histidine-containing phosphotransfer) domain-containing protein